MANPLLSKYKSSSSSSSLLSKYKTTQTSQKASKKKGGGFLGGIVGGAENALGDVRDVTVGAVPGIVHTANTVLIQPAYQDIRHGPTSKQAKKAHKNVAELGKAIGKSYADYYGPLAHGDVDTFLNNVYEHPLNIALDAATVASLGLGAGKTKFRINLSPESD